MPKVIAATGNMAVAFAMRQIEPDVVAAYPITPSTQVMEAFSQFVADGVVRTELVPVESEHSAMSACIGAAAAGGRAMTATSSQGLALMHEVLYIASGMRLPIVMAVANRALSAPINIHGDHSDALGSRDAGWIQLYAESVQEVYDSVIQALKIAEDPRVRLPVMVCMDGFTLSHTLERLELLEDDEVQGFIGEPKPFHPVLDLEHPVTYGPLVLPDYYTELKYQQREAMEAASGVIREVSEEFGRSFGRSYGLLEPYRLEDADVALVLMGSAAGVAKEAVDVLRARGVRAGLLRVRVFRPFPVREVCASLRSVKAVAVLDRADAPGAQGGPLFLDVRSALYEEERRPTCFNRIYGLGGRDLLLEEVLNIYEELQKVTGAGRVDRGCAYLQVRV